MTSTERGTLNPAMRSRAHAITLSTSPCAPGLGTQTAFTASPHFASGTPMTAKVKAASTSAWSATGSGLTSGAYTVGSPADSQSGTLPIAVAMGIASFAGTTSVSGVSGVAGTTVSNGEPSVSQTATGAPQAIGLTAAVFANSTTILTGGYAGKWVYNFDVKLDFPRERLK